MRRLPLRLDLQLFAGEKTEKATPQKKSESREKGQVAKSMEIPTALILFFSFLYFYIFGGSMKDQIFVLFRSTFQDYLNLEITIPSIVSIFSRLALQSFYILAPIMIIAVVTAVLANFFQFGFLFTGDPLKMKLSKLNPIEGAKRVFGLQGIVNFLKSILKMSIVGVVVYVTLSNEKSKIIELSNLSISNILSYASGITLLLGIKIGLIMVVLALFDYLYQKYDYEKNLRMSKQDIKDEMRKSEGDPQVKGKIREKQKKMALQRMMQEIPKADVVITNPTHFAIAIQYDASKMDAPTIIAKGADYVALKIKEVAKQHAIVMMENKLLARALYEQVEIGESIPQDLFQAVAEVLAYVYKLKGIMNE